MIRTESKVFVALVLLVSLVVLLMVWDLYLRERFAESATRSGSPATEAWPTPVPAATVTPTVTPRATPTLRPTTAPTPVPSATSLPPVGRGHARQVPDRYCASGLGWEWREEIEDGQGGSNLIILRACAIRK
jgi:hypothetical protein